MAEACAHVRSGPDLWRGRVLALAAGLLVIAVLPLQALGDPPAILAEISARSASAARLEHVFGGGSVLVPVVLYGTPGTRVDLRARLVQLAPGVTAPVGEPVDVASGVDFSAGIRRELSFDVAIPTVERESRFELIVFLRAPPSGDWRRAGSLSFHAYPNDLLKPLKRWTEQRPLRLHDPSGKLERFLTAQGIAFLDLNARSLEKSDGPVVTLLVGRAGDVASAKARAQRGEAVILFREHARGLPRVERTRWPGGSLPGGSLTVVELELLDRLAVDPQAQTLFLELLRTARSGETNTEEDPRHERQDPE